MPRPPCRMDAVLAAHGYSIDFRRELTGWAEHRVKVEKTHLAGMAVACRREQMVEASDPCGVVFGPAPSVRAFLRLDARRREQNDLRPAGVQRPNKPIQLGAPVRVIRGHADVHPLAVVESFDHFPSPEKDRDHIGVELGDLLCALLRHELTGRVGCHHLRSS